MRKQIFLIAVMAISLISLLSETSFLASHTRYLGPPVKACPDDSLWNCKPKWPISPDVHPIYCTNIAGKKTCNPIRI